MKFSAELRRATPEDAEDLTRLYDLVWSLETPILGEKLAGERRADAAEIRRWVSADPYFVAVADRQVVAAIGCENRHGTLHLVHMVVHPDYRRRGLARRLMAQAEELARQNGAVKIWFDTAPGLAAAREVYAALGYQLCGHLHRHYWGTDIVLYEKLL